MRKRTPLHYAAQSGRNEAVSALLRHGVTKDRRDRSSENHTPLHMAIIWQHPQVVEELLSAGVDDILTEKFGVGCVSMAVGAGFVDMGKLLIGRGVSVTARDFSSRNALHMAAGSNRMETIDVLVEAGVNPGALDYEAKTPLHYAALTPVFRCLIGPDAA